jgi:hypothetical protein
VFIPAKEALLGFYDELMNKTLSRDLERRQRRHPRQNHDRPQALDPL